MDWLALIFKYLDPILAKCLSQQSSEDPQEYLREHYNPETGRMDEGLVSDAMPATRRAIRKASRGLSNRERRDFPRYSREDIRRITESRLIDAMKATPAEIASAFQAGACLADEE